MQMQAASSDSRLFFPVHNLLGGKCVPECKALFLQTFKLAASFCYGAIPWTDSYFLSNNRSLISSVMTFQSYGKSSRVNFVAVGG